jgi:Domain of unknown function (DUF222)
MCERVNPVHAFAGSASAALDRLIGSPTWAMTPDEQAETMVELSRVAARVAELRLRVLVAGDRNQIGAKTGATSTAAWLADATRETSARVYGDLRMARALDDSIFSATREAFAAGRLNEDQMRVIVHAIEDLPVDEVTDEQRDQAQRHLVGLAEHHDAKRLRILGRRVFELLAPEETDRREGEALEREERRARQRCVFSMRDNGDGTSSGWFKLPTLSAEILGKAVQAFAAPRRTNPDAWTDVDGKKVPYRVLLGQAFAELVEHLPVDGLPQAGGVAASIVVTLDLDRLLSGLGAASLDTGGRISASQARRLACNSGLIPTVLGSKSVPLDLGRSTRLHTSHQRTAMAIRDGGCTARGCDRPAAWCEAHHEQPWSEGGGTSVEQGRLLCPRHHQMAHDSAYDMRRLPGGRVRFNKRT